MRRTLRCFAAAWFAILPLSLQATPQAEDDVRHRIKHVFVILENEGYDLTFGPNSKAHYLAQTSPQGVLLTQYCGTRPCKSRQLHGHGTLG